MEEVATFTSLTFDADLYGGAGSDRFDGYERSIAVTEEDDEAAAANEGSGGRDLARRMASFTGPKAKVKIDSLFARMFTDEDFATAAATVDKRGRPRKKGVRRLSRV